MKIEDINYDHLPDEQRWLIASIFATGLEHGGENTGLPNTIEILVNGKEVTMEATAHIAKDINYNSEASYKEGFENGLAEAEYRIKEAVSKLLSEKSDTFWRKP